jgi:hypothetical protein
MSEIDTITYTAREVAAIYRRGFDDPYPDKLGPAEVKGRKAWRLEHLLDLSAREKAMSAGTKLDFRNEAGREGMPTADEIEPTQLQEFEK